MSSATTISQKFFQGDYDEQDPRWQAVDDYTLLHLQSQRPNETHLNAAFKNSLDQGLPPIASSPVFGKMLSLQCRIGRVTHALEVGTLGAYTSIWMASTSPGLKVTTVEMDPYHAKVARENCEKAGVSDRVEIILGKGLDVLPKLKAEIEAGTRPQFGLTYIDADKLNNWAYFEMAVEMSGIGGCIFVDNIVKSGQLVDEKLKDDEMVAGARKVIEGVGKDKRVEAVVMQTVCQKTYDGYLMAVVVEK